MIRAKFAHLIDYTSEVICRDCGTKRPSLYFFGVRDDESGQKIGLCVDCMATHDFSKDREEN
jgi:hypothetical protein